MSGTTRQITSSAGTPSGVNRFCAYGDELAGTSITAEYKYTGQIRDPNGLDHFAMRTYASSLGRWLTPDPSGLAAVAPNNPQTWNRFSYVQNDPASALDLLGLSPFTFQGWGYLILNRDTSSLAGLMPQIPSSDPDPGDQVCAALPTGSAVSLNGNVGGIGGQNARLSLVFNYQSGQVSAFATGGLQVGWNGGAQGSVSGSLLWGPLGQDTSGFSGRFYGGGDSLAVVGGSVAHGGGVAVVSASVGENLAQTITSGGSATETSAPLHLNPALSGFLGGLMADPVILSLRLTVCD